MKYLVLDYQFNGIHSYSFSSVDALKSFFNGTNVDRVNAVVYTVSEEKDLEKFYPERHVVTVGQFPSGEKSTFTAYGDE